MVFVDGVYNDELSDVSAIPSDIFAGSALSDKLTGQQKSDIDAVLVSAAYISIILLMLVPQNRVKKKVVQCSTAAPYEQQHSLKASKVDRSTQQCGVLHCYAPC
jgi:hypothetical protein